MKSRMGVGYARKFLVYGSLLFIFLAIFLGVAMLIFENSLDGVAIRRWVNAYYSELFTWRLMLYSFVFFLLRYFLAKRIVDCTTPKKSIFLDSDYSRRISNRFVAACSFYELVIAQNLFGKLVAWGN